VPDAAAIRSILEAAQATADDQAPVYTSSGTFRADRATLERYYAR
jgi:hypothetical protein